MRKFCLLLIILVVIGRPAKAQLNPLQSHGAPAGTCTGSMTDTDLDTGFLYSCKPPNWILAGGGSGLPAAGLIGQTVVNTAAGTGTWQSSGIPLCNAGAVIAATPYTLLQDSGTATRDRTSLCVVSTAGAGTFHVLAGSTAGVGTNFSFGFLNDGTGTWTIDNNAGSDTFNLGTTGSDALASFTILNGEQFSITNSGISNGSGGVTWDVRPVTGYYANLTPATVGTPQAGPVRHLSCGTEWTGAGASTQDCLNVQITPGAGLNTFSTMALSHSSSSSSTASSWTVDGAIYTPVGSSIAAGLTGSNIIMYMNPANGGFITNSGGFLGLSNNGSYGNGGSLDTSVNRLGPGVVGMGIGAGATSTGRLKSAQTLQVTGSNYTTTSTTLAAAGVVTGLSFTTPTSFASNWSFSCDLVYSQATAAAANLWGITTSGTAPTSMLAAGEVKTSLANAEIEGTAVITTATSTTVVTATPSAFGAIGTTADMFKAHFSGTIEAPSNASPSIFGIAVATGNASDALTIYRGSACWVY